MIVLNDIACGNDYSPAATIAFVYESSGGYAAVRDNDAVLSLAWSETGAAGGDQGGEQWTPEFRMAPGNLALSPMIIGVRFRNANPGQVAHVTAVLSSKFEPAVFLTAGGVSSAAGGGPLATTDGVLTVAPTTELFIGDNITLTNPAVGEARLDGGGGCCPALLPSLSDEILGLVGLDAFWKLNETTGTTAHDSSGNGYNMEPRTGYSPPTWANATTPYGENAPVLGGSIDEQQGAVPKLTGDMTLMCWVQKSTDIDCALVGQGTAIAANHQGVFLNWNNSASASWFEVFIGGPTNHAVTSDIGYTAGWHMVAATRASNVWRLYVDGALQAGSYNDGGSGYTVSSTTGAWIGLSPSGTLSTAFHLSYVAILQRALTATEIANLYANSHAPPTDGSAPGKVITANADGSTSWQYPTNVNGTSYAKLLTGTNLAAVNNHDNTVTLNAAASDPAADTKVWLPLSTTLAGDDVLVYDATHQLIPTLTPI